MACLGFLTVADIKGDVGATRVACSAWLAVPDEILDCLPRLEFAFLGKVCVGRTGGREALQHKPPTALRQRR